LIGDDNSAKVVNPYKTFTVLPGKLRHPVTYHLILNLRKAQIKDRH